MPPGALVVAGKSVEGKGLDGWRAGWCSRSWERAVVVVLAAGVLLVFGVWGPSVAHAAPVGQITEFSTGLNSGSRPSAIAAGPDGNLWFTDAARPRAIGRITPAGQITEFSTGLNSGSSPGGIAAGPDGNLWFTDEGTHPRYRADHVGWADHRVLHRPEQRQLPRRDREGPDGDLWFTTRGVTPAIGRITPSGQVTEFSAGLNGGSARVGSRPGPGRQPVVHRRGHHATRSGGSRRAGRSPSSRRACMRQLPDWDRGGARRQPVVHRRGFGTTRDRAGSPRAGRSPSSQLACNGAQFPGRDRGRADGNLWFRGRGHDHGDRPRHAEWGDH